MIKKIISLFFISVLISCSTNTEQNKKLQEILKKQITANIEIAKDGQYKIESYYHENKAKYGSIYILSKRADSLMNNFYQNTKNPILEFEPINNSYNETIDSMLNLLDQYGKKIINQEHTEFESSSILYKELMLLEISRLYFDIIFYYSLSYNEGWTFINRDIKFKSQVVDDGKYSTIIHSNFLKHFPKRFLIIDTVLHNGKIIPQEFNYEPNYSVFNLTADSLLNGNYEIRGYVLFGVSDKMEKQYFKHKFSIQ